MTALTLHTYLAITATVAGEIADMSSVDTFVDGRFALHRASGGIRWRRRTISGGDADVVDGDVRLITASHNTLDDEAEWTVAVVNLV